MCGRYSQCQEKSHWVVTGRICTAGERAESDRNIEAERLEIIGEFRVCPMGVRPVLLEGAIVCRVSEGMLGSCH